MLFFQVKWKRYLNMNSITKFLTAEEDPTIGELILTVESMTDDSFDVLKNNGFKIEEFSKLDDSEKNDYIIHIPNRRINLEDRNHVTETWLNEVVGDTIFKHFNDKNWMIQPVRDSMTPEQDNTMKNCAVKLNSRLQPLVTCYLVHNDNIKYLYLIFKIKKENSNEN